MLLYTYAAHAKITPGYVFVHPTILLIKKQNAEKAHYLFILNFPHAATKVGMRGGTVHIIIIIINISLFQTENSQHTHTSKLSIQYY